MPYITIKPNSYHWQFSLFTELCLLPISDYIKGKKKISKNTKYHKVLATPKYV